MYIEYVTDRYMKICITKCFPVGKKFSRKNSCTWSQAVTLHTSSVMAIKVVLHGTTCNGIF